MQVNSNKPDRWKYDIARSVDLYNDWFLEFAPDVYRSTRRETIKQNDLFEARRLAMQNQLDSAKTPAERNKLGQFATPTVLATEMLEYAKSLLHPNLPIRFLDPAIGTGSFHSALLRSFSPSRVADAVGYEIDAHKATAANVYLMLYPKSKLERVLKGNPELFKAVWQALNKISPEILIGEGRVYGGGLYKVEPRELANAPADTILAVLPGSFGKHIEQVNLF